MTKINPITSEEVLARQVKESAQKVFDQPDGTISSSPGTSSTNIANDEEQHVNVNPGIVARAESQPVKLSDKLDEESDKLGYSYRLPLGSYLLSLVYLQVSLVTVYSIVMIIWSRSADMVDRESWGLVVVSLVLSFFIFSGNNILRILTVSVSSLLIILLGYQLVNSVMTYISFYQNAPSLVTEIFLAVFSTYMLGYVLGILLLIATIIYLLRKKVAAAYQ